jgi:hypothetical protein
MPPTWLPVLELAMGMPAASVPPSTYRAHVLRALPALPTSCDALTDLAQRERARCLLAFIIAGWRAGKPSEYDDPDAPPPASLLRPFEALSTMLNRAPRIGLVDLFLYNWRLEPPKLPNKAAGTDLDDTEVSDGPRAARPSLLPPAPPPAGAPSPLCSPVTQPLPIDFAEASRDAASAHAMSDGGGVANGETSPTSAALGPSVLQCTSLSANNRPRISTMARVMPVQRFLCVEEEDWFCRLHVTLAGEAAHEMAAIRKCFSAVGVDQQARAAPFAQARPHHVLLVARRRTRFARPHHPRLVGANSPIRVVGGLA